MSGLDELNERQLSILDMAARDMTTEEIAIRMQTTPHAVVNALARIYPRLGVRSIHGAAALYANRMGLDGEALPQLARPQTVPGFKIGKFRGDAVAVSTEISRPTDITTVVLPHPYQPPRTISTQRLTDVRLQVEESAKRAGRPGYDGTLFAIQRLEPQNEKFAPLHLLLQPASYFTYMGLKNHLTEKERIPYVVDPWHIVDPPIPLPLGTSVFVIAGNPPKLIVLRRAQALATFQGYYASTGQGWGEGEKDTRHGTFDFVYSMHRELGEELCDVIHLGDFRERLELLALTYFIPQQSFAIMGCVEFRELDAETLCELPKKTPEGVHELLPFPRSRRDTAAFKELCNHLLSQRWQPGEALALFLLLRRKFGLNPLLKLLGASLRVPSSEAGEADFVLSVAAGRVHV